MNRDLKENDIVRITTRSRKVNGGAETVDRVFIARVTGSARGVDFKGRAGQYFGYVPFDTWKRACSERRGGTRSRRRSAFRKWSSSGTSLQSPSRVGIRSRATGAMT
jgi:hypothetical protein